ncbi:hypothetical protein LEP1GSC048_3360 [Leptospira santarosai serovar Shermani str. 1342KT]|nr:hypothetical protein LEP1GSC048_3360 [Leptospira santarosai serovar Shermani str. 1342KT]
MKEASKERIQLRQSYKRKSKLEFIKQGHYFHAKQIKRANKGTKRLKTYLGCYSIHAPEVECISKGKSHKRYEFGCKVSLVFTSKSNWIVGVQALHGNPYGGHTLKDAINQMEKIVGR